MMNYVAIAHDSTVTSCDITSNYNHVQWKIVEDARMIILSVMNLFLRVRNKNNSCIRKTQENSIEFLVQSSLPYILLLMVHAHYCAPYPK